MKKRVLLVTLTVIVAVLFLLRDNKGSAGQNAVQVRSAAENYSRYCSGCHGRNLDKFAARKWMEEKGNAAVIKSIKEGLVTSGMPAFGKTFSDSEIEALASFVKQGLPKDRRSLRPAVTEGGVTVSEVQRFVVDTIVTGLKVPWGMDFLPNGDILISERGGTLHRFSKGVLSAPIGGVPEVLASGQGGLLDIKLHPDYKNNGWIYFSYSFPSEINGKKVANTAIMRARLKGNTLTDQENIYKGTPLTDRTYHFGCKLAFDGKGHLFFGIGDRGQHFDFPQNTDNSNGKIHRINDDGTIASDNPFNNTPGAVKSIYSYGHRNPQGTVIDPASGTVWETEHGPKGGDELNIIRPGVNYGWPVISYGINYDGTILTELKEKEGMEQPVHQWTPSIGPCGMTFVTGDRYRGWKNNLLIGSLAFQYLERVVLENNKVIHREKLLDGIGRVRNVVMSPDGFVYVAIEIPGKILRLTPVE
jgi:glucose/arabinose dehydrogenase